MKRKAGQAPSVRSAEVRSNALAPVRSGESNRPAPVRVEASRAPAHTGSAQRSAASRTAAKNGSSRTASKSASKAAPRRVKAKRKSHVGVVIAVIVLVILLGAGGYYGYLYSTGYFKPHVEVTNSDGTVANLMADEVYAELSQDVSVFYPGTFINDVDVSGMTADQAYEAVSKELTDEGNPISVKYTLKLDGKEYPLDFSDAKFEYNTREVIDSTIGINKVSDPEDYTKLIECYNYKQSLKNTPAKYETSYKVAIDGVSEKVHNILDPLIDQYSTVKDAEIGEFNPSTKEFTITPEETGMTIDIDAAVEKVKELFDNAEYTGSVVVPSVKKEPEVTTEKLKANFGLRGEHTTKASNNANRNTNLSQACKKINGTILKPGQEFSFNKVVGKRTREAGFKEATVILGGRYEQGLGGGVCQVSGTLYDAVLKSDLKITERHPHAWPSDYVLEGLDATVDYGSLDFKFKNNTDYQIIILMWFDSSKREVHAQIYGKRFPEEQTIALRSEVVSTSGYGKTEYVEDKTMEAGKTKTTREAHQGKTVKTFKIWKDKDGKEIKRETIGTTTYNAYGKQISVGTKNADGTYNSVDPKTGQLKNATPTPVPTKHATTKPTTPPDPPATNTPKPTDPPPPPATNTPKPETPPDNPPENNDG